LTLKGQENLTGNNYYQKIYDQNGENIVFYLWAFDSMDDECLGVKGWGCVNLDVI